MSIDVEIDGLEALEARWSRLCEDLDGAAKDSVTEAAAEGAKFARANHTFKNQSGELEASIKSEYAGTTPPEAPETSLAGGLLGLLGSNAVANDSGEYAQHWARIFSTSEYASFIEKGTRAHPIDPKRRTWLSWEPMQGDRHFAKHVDHPGTKPMPFLEPAGDHAAKVLHERLEGRVNALCAAFQQ